VGAHPRELLMMVGHEPQRTGTVCHTAAAAVVQKVHALQRAPDALAPSYFERSDAGAQKARRCQPRQVKHERTSIKNLGGRDVRPLISTPPPPALELPLRTLCKHGDDLEPAGEESTGNGARHCAGWTELCVAWMGALPQSACASAIPRCKTTSKVRVSGGTSRCCGAACRVHRWACYGSTAALWMRMQPASHVHKPRPSSDMAVHCRALFGTRHCRAL